MTDQPSLILTLSPLALWAVFAVFVVAFTLIFLACKLLLRKPFIEQRLDEVVLSRQNGATNNRRNAGNLPIQMIELKTKTEKEKKTDGIVEKFLKKFRQKSFLKPDKLKTVFEQAGWSTYDAQSMYIMGKIGMMTTVLLMGYFIVSSDIAVYKLPSSARFNLMLLALGIGWFSFDIFLKSTIKTRVQSIEKGLPDAIDLMIVCIEAGLSFNKALERVAKELLIFNPNIARELAMTAIELELLLDQRKALQNFSNRVPSPAVKSLTTTLFQSLQQGTPIMNTLEVISVETRVTRMQQAEERAAKLPSLLILPLAAFILPNMFIVLLGPTFVQVGKIL